MFSFIFHFICNSTEAVCSLTYKCSKSIWGQFLEDNWIGGSVSLENLGKTKTWRYFLLLLLTFADLVNNIYLWPQGHCHIHTILNVEIFKSSVSIHFIMYSPAFVTVFFQQNTCMIMLTLCGKIFSRASPLSPAASSSFLASSVVLPFMRASVWARKFATSIYNHS